MCFVKYSTLTILLLIFSIGYVTGERKPSTPSDDGEVTLHNTARTRQDDSCFKQDVEVQSNCNSTILGDTFLKSTLSFPEWYRNGDWGLRKCSRCKKVKLDKNLPGSDDEEEIAWNNFFFETTNGIILEVGAMDGKTMSVSKFFEVEAGWRSILIEGHPKLSALLPKNRPNSINFNAVICEKPRVVHFVRKPAVGGIVEFMTSDFLKRHHPYLFGKNGELDDMRLEKLKNVVKLQCVPLSHLLLPLNIYHINFFVLDLNGAELNVLKGIDFERIKLDVISVETDPNRDSGKDSENYGDSVIQFLTSKGYVLWKRKMGRNSWFTHPDFQGFSQDSTKATGIVHTPGS